MATQITATQNGITVATTITAGGVPLQHAEGIVVSTTITAGNGTKFNHAEGVVVSTAIAGANSRRWRAARKLTLTAAVAAAFGANAAQAQADSFYDRFGQEIEKRLDGKVVGYSYSIGNRFSGATEATNGNGAARLNSDGVEIADFHADTRGRAASTAKTITAAALLKALNQRGLGINTRIEDYLPSCWAKGNDVDELRFKDVLQHRSGLDQYNGDNLAGLRQVIANGMPGIQRLSGDPYPYEYNNANYSLVRVLLPFVLEPSLMKEQFSSFGCNDIHGSLNFVVSQVFRYYQDDMLAAVGAAAYYNPQFDGQGSWAAAYNHADRTVPGIAPPPGEYLKAGAGRMAISAPNYMKFLTGLDGGDILPREPSNQITVEDMYGTPTFRMGIDGSRKGAYGVYLYKNGTCPDHDGVGCKASAMIFPGVLAWVNVNSSTNAFSGTIEKVLGDAYDAARAALFN